MSDRGLSATSYIGSAASILAGLTLTEWGVVVGILTALVTMIINAWAKADEVKARRREAEREEEIMRLEAELKREMIDQARRKAGSRK